MEGEKREIESSGYWSLQDCNRTNRQIGILRCEEWRSRTKTKRYGKMKTAIWCHITTKPHTYKHTRRHTHTHTHTDWQTDKQIERQMLTRIHWQMDRKAVTLSRTGNDHTVLSNTALYSTMQCYTVLCSAVSYCTVLYCTSLHCTILCSPTLYCDDAL